MEKKIFNFDEFLVECYNENIINESKGGEGIDEALIIKILEAEKRIALKKIGGKKLLVKLSNLFPSGQWNNE